MDDPVDEIMLLRLRAGRLSAEEERRLRWHLEDDPRLRRTYEALCEEERLIREALLLDQVEMDRSIARRVREKAYVIRQKVQRQRRARRLALRAAVVAGLVLSAGLLGPKLVPRQPVARLSSSDPARVIREGRATVLPSGAELYSGNVVAAESGEMPAFELADGTQVWVDEHSRMQLVRGGFGNWLVLEYGHVHVRMPPGAQNLMIETNAGFVHADWATFDLRLLSPGGEEPGDEGPPPRPGTLSFLFAPERPTGATRWRGILTVTEGEARLTALADRPLEVLVRRGQQAEFAPGWVPRPSQLRLLENTDRLAGWLDQVKLARDRKLKEMRSHQLEQTDTLALLSRIGKSHLAGAQWKARLRQASEKLHEARRAVELGRRFALFDEAAGVLRTGTTPAPPRDHAADLLDLAYAMILYEAGGPCFDQDQPLSAPTSLPEIKEARRRLQEAAAVLETLCAPGKEQARPLDGRDRLLAHLLCGWAHFNAGLLDQSAAGGGPDFTAACRAFQRCIAAFPEAVEKLFAQVGLGRAQARLADERDRKLAVLNLEHVLSTPPFGARGAARLAISQARRAAYCALAELYLLRKNPEEALEVASDFLVEFPLYRDSRTGRRLQLVKALAHLALAESLATSHDWLFAREHYDQALRSGPRLPDEITIRALLGKAHAYLLACRLAEVEEILELLRSRYKGPENERWQQPFDQLERDLVAEKEKSASRIQVNPVISP